MLFLVSQKMDQFEMRAIDGESILPIVHKKGKIFMMWLTSQKIMYVKVSVEYLSVVCMGGIMGIKQPARAKRGNC